MATAARATLVSCTWMRATRRPGNGRPPRECEAHERRRFARGKKIAGRPSAATRKRTTMREDLVPKGGFAAVNAAVYREVAPRVYSYTLTLHAMHSLTISYCAVPRSSLAIC
jgi:hypothetical protein